MERREFLKSSTAFICGFPMMQTSSLDCYNKVLSVDDADITRIRIGKIQCTVFRDYMFKYQAKDFFINARPEEVNESMNKYHVDVNNIPSPFIAVLVELDNNKKILIDTGVGFSERPVDVRGNQVFFKGRLHQLLLQQSIKMEDITDVVVTHFHPDHIGGIFSDDGQLNFPNAQFHMHEAEWNFWHSAQSDNQPGQFKYFIEKNITKLKNHNLHLINGDFIDILPGVTAVKADGHTPGQIAVVIHSEKKHLLYISDALLHPLHIERLDWQTNYDLDQQKARQSRIKLLELSYRDNMLMNAFHFDFPGLGRIEKHKENWTWRPV